MPAQTPPEARQVVAVIRRIRGSGIAVRLIDHVDEQRARPGRPGRGYVLENGRIILDGSGRARLEKAHVTVANLGLYPPGVAVERPGPV